MMTIMQLIEALRRYGADVLILAVGVSVITSLLKKTVFKNWLSKVYVFLPFAVGIVLYAVYRMAVTASVFPLTCDIASTLEGGFGCGCAATLYYVVYEQFFRKKKTTFSLSPLFEGIVPEKLCETAADELLTGSKGLSEEDLFTLIEEILRKYALPAPAEAELALRIRLIAAFLKTL